MTERELFDAIGRLPEQYRTEALAQEQPQPEQPNEIDMLFDSASHTNAVQYRTMPAAQKNTERPAVSVRPRTPQKPQKNGIIGLTAIAAAVALTVGMFAWKIRQDSGYERNPGAAVSGDFVQESDISAELVTDTGAAQRADYDPNAQTGAPNFLGGHGALKTVMNYGVEIILADDDYWYIYGERRISKTKQNEQGHLYSELICQTPGCPHSDESCPRYKYGYNLRSDGKDLYLCVPNHECPDDETLMKLSENGEFERFFSLSQHNAIELALQPKGNLKYVEYLYILRLGDTDTYYLAMTLGYYNRQTSGEEQVNVGVLFDAKNDSFALTHYSADPPLYDAEHALLYVFCPKDEQDFYYRQEYSAFVYDMKQVKLTYDPQDAEVMPVRELEGMSNGVLLNGKLYYYGNFYYEEKNPASPMSWNLLCFDPDLAAGAGAVKMLENNTQRLDLTGADGRMYFRLHSSVGKDSICAYEPDENKVEVIYETSSAIQWMGRMTDSSFIRFLTDNGEMFLVNGEAIHVES